MTSKLIPTVILSIALVSGLSACSVEVVDPGTTSFPSPTAGPEDMGGEFTTGDCDGKDIEVSEDSSTVVLSGRCGVVNVTATGATVNLESADSVLVVGLENTVIMDDKAGAVTLKGDTNSFNANSVDSIDIQGNGNQVTLNTADVVKLSGDENFVVWTTGAASAEDTGTGNSVVGP